ncbi:hypothetical protein LSAT2_008113 [Lamellibrachia satsuma]|nr:hypothetical protein LSAT2_008113 [Lamellibrachia satsuma]
MAYGSLLVCLSVVTMMTYVLPPTSAFREITCFSFEKDFSGLHGVWAGTAGKVDIVESAGPHGRCAYFDGTGGYMYVPRFRSAYDAWGQFSLSMWYKPVSQKKMALLTTDLCEDLPALTVLAFGKGLIRVSMNFAKSRSGSVLNWFGRYNEWNHVVVSWGGTHVKMYINGNLVSTFINEVVPEHNRLYNSACDLTIGAAPKNTKSGVTPFHGYIDEVCFYKVALNESDVNVLSKLPNTRRNMKKKKNATPETADQYRTDNRTIRTEIIITKG